MLLFAQRIGVELLRAGSLSLKGLCSYRRHPFSCLGEDQDTVQEQEQDLGGGGGSSLVLPAPQRTI